MDKAKLVSLIKSYLQNEETTFVATIDDIIKNTEDKIFQEIEFDNFRKTATLTFTAGTKTIATPSDYVLSLVLLL